MKVSRLITSSIVLADVAIEAGKFWADIIFPSQWETALKFDEAVTADTLRMHTHESEIVRKLKIAALCVALVAAPGENRHGRIPC